MRVLVFLFFISGVAQAQGVGDISFDARTDNAEFLLCNPSHVWQGYQLKTEMDETSLLVTREFKTQFQTKDEWKKESGFVRIRFIVNCQGQADRFRLLVLDTDLAEKKLSETLFAHILNIAKSIQWPARRANRETVDYYHHFSIRIVEGQLVDIIQ